MKKKLIRLFGQRLRAIRQDKGMTQTAFARKMGMSNSYLCDIESGNVGPGLYFLHQLIEYYNIDPLYMIRGTEPVFIAEEKEKSVENETQQELKSQPELLDFGENTALVREMLSYFKRSPLVKFNLLGFFSKFIIENKAIIEEDIKKQAVV
jgi:transcriptional regulator with XRE-family HTH domain